MFYAHRSDKHNFIMCTNGRCGSTLLKRWYLQLHEMPMPIEGDYASVHQALLYDDPRFRVDLGGFNAMKHFKFLVVRNPWERLVSYYKVWVVLQQKNSDGLGSGVTFKGVVEHLAREGAKDAHSSPQTNGLEGLEFDRIVYLENIESDMRSLCNATRVPFLEDFFSTKIFEAPTTDVQLGRKVFKMPGSYFIDNNAWPRWRDFYTPPLVEAVAKFYAEDIRRFGYDWKGGNHPVSFPIQPEVKAKGGSSQRALTRKQQRPGRRRGAGGAGGAGGI